MRMFHWKIIACQFLCFLTINSLAHERSRLSASISGKWSCSTEILSFWFDGDTGELAIQKATDYAKGWYVNPKTKVATGSPQEGFRPANVLPETCHCHETLINLWNNEKKYRKLLECKNNPQCKLDSDEFQVLNDYEEYIHCSKY